MTDQCYDDDPDRGREPEPLNISIPNDKIFHCSGTPTYISTIPEEWMRFRDDTVIRNTDAKLELAKKALNMYKDELHKTKFRQIPTIGVYFRIRNILDQLED